MTLTALHFTIAALAVWRLASLLANEDGAFYIFKRLRNYCQKLDMTTSFWRTFGLWDGINCEWCNSIWLAAALTALLGWHWLTIFALSAAAISFKYIVQTLQQLCSYAEKLNNIPNRYNPVNVPDEWTMSQISARAESMAERKHKQ